MDGKTTSTINGVTYSSSCFLENEEGDRLKG
ncbi:hypothetical protein CIPAW_07G090700 [Carya illinoinensis]|uniref:Uncharacterized protein n=1 Tax=Carya illinoinensis TaxID=32201 RepID=A0A8T1PZJ1_CARIL|nr:hypothetical protein CIPAW_07G090700 [Carya illinoinensis]